MFLDNISCTKLVTNCQLSQEQERRKIQEYENYLKEKMQVDEIVKKIYDEDKRYLFSQKHCL